MDKNARLVIFFAALNAAEKVPSSSEARLLLEQVLNKVEDEHSGIPFSPQSSKFRAISDGRMYPPRDDAERGSTSIFRRFITKGNVVLFGINGSIKIQSLHGDIVFEKPGADSRLVGEL